jgi:hypothetical protein
MMFSGKMHDDNSNSSEDLPSENKFKLAREEFKRRAAEREFFLIL